MDVGLIGLLQMGIGMAANLLKAGHRVTVYNRTRAKAETLVAQGARAGGYRWRLPKRGRHHHVGE